MLRAMLRSRACRGSARGQAHVVDGAETHVRSNLVANSRPASPHSLRSAGGTTEMPQLPQRVVVPRRVAPQLPQRVVVPRWAVPRRAMPCRPAVHASAASPELCVGALLPRTSRPPGRWTHPYWIRASGRSSSNARASRRPPRTGLAKTPPPHPPPRVCCRPCLAAAQTPSW